MIQEFEYHTAQYYRDLTELDYPLTPKRCLEISDQSNESYYNHKEQGLIDVVFEADYPDYLDMCVSKEPKIDNLHRSLIKEIQARPNYAGFTYQDHLEIYNRLKKSSAKI